MADRESARPDRAAVDDPGPAYHALRELRAAQVAAWQEAGSPRRRRDDGAWGWCAAWREGAAVVV